MKLRSSHFKLYSPSRTRKPLAFRHGMKVRLDKECTKNRKVCDTLSIQNVGIFYFLSFVLQFYNLTDTMQT
ncbi:hypothetical protein BVG01_25440 [Bacillus anthracis]|nr:hypothetical protein BVG01_25440 [Bacillus anthracis]